MKNSKFIIAAIAAAAVLPSCSKNGLDAYLSDPDAVRISAVVGSLTKTNPVGTPEEQTTFNEGDRIGISNGGEYFIYVLRNGSWVPYDASRYLRWESNSMTFKAFYPENNANTFEGGHAYTDQSSEYDIQYSDFMTVEVKASKTADNLLNLTMERRTARVVVKVAGFQDEFDGADPVVSGVKVYSQWLVPYVEPYSPEPIESLDKDGVFYALVCPSGAKPDQTFLELTVKYGNPVQSKSLTVKGVPAMEAGKSYTYSVIVGKNTVKVGDVTVHDWTSGAAIDDGQTEGIAAWSGTAEAFADRDFNGNSLGQFVSEPILIKNAEQLAYLAEQVNAGNDYQNRYFKLADDINLANKPWTPIGCNMGFRGNFDGNDKRIFGLKVEGDFDKAGLFGRVAYGSVKNVIVESADIDVSSFDTAVLCGYAIGATIENCSVRGTVESTGSHIGGLAGSMDDSSTMRGCTAEVSVKGDAYVGGLCGYVDEGSIISGCSIVNSSVEGTDDFFGGVGGIVGTMENKNIVVENCGFSGTVKGAKYVGGAVGRVDQYAVAKLSDLVVFADVLSGGIGGGLVGRINKRKGGTGVSEFSDCGFNGTITNTSTGAAQLGAAVGQDKSTATFTGCWYNADRTGDLPVVWSATEDAAGKDYSGIEAKHLGK